MDLTESSPSPLSRVEAVTPSRDLTPHCPICLDSLAEVKESGSFLASTVCGHIFCGPCLKSAVASNGKCPTCRKNIKTGTSWHRIFL